MERARAAGFPYSCDLAVGRPAATLAAGVPEGGRVLEIGTGVGVGPAWLVSGLLPRTDAAMTTIGHDPDRAGPAARGSRPDFGPPRGDALELLPKLGTYDPVFAYS
jgi:demethylmenaquinone methyltransferase/2-methoxy-6-polyprenyl-1,4-benzoquinol methylase